MPLTQNDLKQIEKIVDKRVTLSEKTITEKLGKKIENEIEGLAVMTKHGFDAVDKRFDRVERQISVHDFRMTEMVHKADYYKLEERVGRLEQKTGLRK